MGESNRSGRKNAFRKETASHDEPTEFTAAVLAAEPTSTGWPKPWWATRRIAPTRRDEAILRAWERLDTLRQPQYFRTWLTRILINECKGILPPTGAAGPL